VSSFKAAEAPCELLTNAKPESGPTAEAANDAWADFWTFFFLKRRMPILTILRSA
jgi:hypothetical protein